MAQVKQANNSFPVRQLPGRADPGPRKDGMCFTCSHCVFISSARESGGGARSRARCSPQPRHPDPAPPSPSKASPRSRTPLFSLRRLSLLILTLHNQLSPAAEIYDSKN